MAKTLPQHKEMNRPKSYARLQKEAEEGNERLPENHGYGGSKVSARPAKRARVQVEEHEDATIRSWGHESANVGGKRVLILTKPVGTPVLREVDSGVLLAKKKKKKKKRKGPASTEGLSEAELKRREWQKKKQKEAIERQQKGLPRVMPSKRRRANNPRRKGHNNDKKVQPDGQAASFEDSNGGNVGGFMQPGAWQAS